MDVRALLLHHAHGAQIRICLDKNLELFPCAKYGAGAPAGNSSDGGGAASAGAAAARPLGVADAAASAPSHSAAAEAGRFRAPSARDLLRRFKRLVSRQQRAAGLQAWDDGMLPTPEQLASSLELTLALMRGVDGPPGAQLRAGGQAQPEAQGWAQAPATEELVGGSGLYAAEDGVGAANEDLCPGPPDMAVWLPDFKVDDDTGEGMRRALSSSPWCRRLHGFWLLAASGSNKQT